MQFGGSSYFTTSHVIHITQPWTEKAVMYCPSVPYHVLGSLIANFVHDQHCTYTYQYMLPRMHTNTHTHTIALMSIEIGICAPKKLYMFVLSTGLNTRGNGGKKYFRKRFPNIQCKIKGVTKMVNINTWLKCPRSKAAAAAFIGTDYNTPLRAVNLQNGSVEQMVKAFMKRKDLAQQDKYLDTLERTSKFSTTGSKVRLSIIARLRASDTIAAHNVSETGHRLQNELATCVQPLLALSCG